MEYTTLCRSRIVLRAAALGLLVLFGACAGTGSPSDFVARGPARALPPDGALRSATAEQFEGMLVGARGRPVVVNVWASWCGPCRVEAPLLQRAAERYAGEVVFLGVDSRDDPGPAKAFIRRYGIAYPNVFDGSGDIRALLSLRGFPTTYIFDSAGRLQASVVGGISEQALAAHIAAARRR